MSRRLDRSKDRPSAAASLVLAMLHAYRFTLSPALAALGVRCRHEPSCSAYALDAVRRHGAWFGAWMAAARWLRCRPGGSSGYDPAPADVGRARFWSPWRAADWRGPRTSAQMTARDPLSSSGPNSCGECDDHA